MTDLPNWAVAVFAPVLSGIAAFGAAWIGVRIAVAEHGILLTALRKEFDSLKNVFDRQNEERSGYIAQIRENSTRLDVLVARADRNRGDITELTKHNERWATLLQIVCKKVDVPWVGGE